MFKPAIVAAILPAAENLPSASLSRDSLPMTRTAPTPSSQPTSRIGSSTCMTEYLIAARAAIILWTTLAVMPAEVVFDAIEAELERRSVEL